MVPDKRLYSVDILRGFVMILMALDHTRHFFINVPIDELNVSKDVPWLFCTYWIPHFCAPVFLFLAGVSIWLMSGKDNNPKATSVFLVKRGLWLIFLEVTLLNFFWDSTFHKVELQILWVFGISFILMSFLVFLPKGLNIAIAIAAILLHNLFDGYVFNGDLSFADYLMIFLHSPGDFVVAKSMNVLVLFTIVPWSAVLLLGYCIAPVFSFSDQKRKRYLVISGILMIICFLVLRGFNLYGDQYHWSIQDKGTIYSIMSFIEITKYPASLQYILITLGPSLILLAILDNIPENRLKRVRILGQVALFFYIVHIPFIRIVKHIYYWIFKTEPNGVSFYCSWALIVIGLYFICRIYYNFKIARKKDPRYWWLKYL